MADSIKTLGSSAVERFSRNIEIPVVKKIAMDEP